jgi:hypothetical protein
MPARSGGLFGDGGLGRQLVEAAAKRTLGVDIAEEHALRAKLVEAAQDLRLADRLNHRLGMLALNAVGRFAGGQDDTAENRLAVADRVRSIARVDSHMQYAVRLRNAFCFGRGVTEGKAADDEVQAVLDDLWLSPANMAELTSAEAQWRAGKDLWEVCNVYTVVFADGLDGRVLLAGLQHDQVVNVARDPKVWRRVLYYLVKEFVYEFDFEKRCPKPNPKQQVVYYEALDGMRELEEDLKAGRQAPPAPPAHLLRPGRVLHVAANRGREQAFGEPELRTAIKWAAAFSDLGAGQVEKAKAAQRYLSKVTVTGARSEQQLTDVAMRAVGRRSPLATAFDDLAPEDERDPRNAPTAGGQLWGNEAVRAEPFALDAGSGNARQDMESVSQAFASGTNFPGHYFFGDPGSLAGSMSCELPVLKLSDQDQALWLAVFRKLCDLRIERAVAVGLLSERREPTDAELAAGAELGADGLVERDMTYQIDMPEALRRNLPELMQLVTDTSTTFDPGGESEPLQRALVGYVLGNLLEFPDTPALVERIFAEPAQTVGGGAPVSTDEPPTSTGPDGKQHPPDNPMGVKQKAAVVEAAAAVLWGRLQDPDDPLAIAMRDLANPNGVTA